MDLKSFETASNVFKGLAWMRWVLFSRSCRDHKKAISYHLIYRPKHAENAGIANRKK